MLTRCVGEAAQVRVVFQIIPDAWRLEIAHVRAQRLVAIQMSRLFARFQQTHQPQEPPVSPHR